MSKETCDGLIALHIEIKINPADFFSWDAQRIEAYFDGLAKAIAAANGAVVPPSPPPAESS